MDKFLQFISVSDTSHISAVEFTLSQFCMAVRNVVCEHNDSKFQSFCWIASRDIDDALTSAHARRF